MIIFKGIYYLLRWPRYFIAAWRKHYQQIKQEAWNESQS